MGKTTIKAKKDSFTQIDVSNAAFLIAASLNGSRLSSPQIFRDVLAKSKNNIVSVTLDNGQVFELYVSAGPSQFTHPKGVRDVLLYFKTLHCKQSSISECGNPVSPHCIGCVAAKELLEIEEQS